MSDRSLRLFAPDSLSQSLKFYLSASGLIRAIGIGRGILLTWLISKTDFGTYQLGLLLANLLLPLLSLGLHEGFIRYVPEHETKGRLWIFVRRAVPFSLAVGVGSCILLFLLCQPLSVILLGSLASTTQSGTTSLSSAVDHSTLTQFVAWCVAALICYHLVLAVLRGRRMFRAVSMMELSASVVFTLAAVLVALGGQGSGVVILATYTGANMLCALSFGVPALLSIRRESVGRGPIEASAALPALLKYSIWAGLATLCWQLLLWYPAWHLNRAWGEELFATFSAVRILTQLAHIAPAVMSIVVVGAVTKNWETAGREVALTQLNLATKAGLAVVLVLCLIMAAFKGLVILLFRTEYAHGEGVIPLLLLFYLLAGALGFMVIRFSLIKKSRLVFTSWVAGCVVVVALSFAWIGDGDPAYALIMTGWVGVAGVSASLVLALCFLNYHQLLPDRGTLVLVAGIFLLATPRVVIVVGCFAIVLLASTTSLIFNPQERRTLLQQALKLLARRNSPEV